MYLERSLHPIRAKEYCPSMFSEHSKGIYLWRVGLSALYRSWTVDPVAPMSEVKNAMWMWPNHLLMTESEKIDSSTLGLGWMMGH